MKKALLSLYVFAALSGCTQDSIFDKELPVLNADIVIKNGRVFLGDMSGEKQLDIAICQQRICALVNPQKPDKKIIAKQIIDAKNNIVSPGFIDPHTHSLEQLLSKDKNHNLNYLTQGVTTVVNGNDGGGAVDTAKLATQLNQNGIGTNVALYVGHNSVRKQVMGKVNRHATADELAKMQQYVSKAMQAGALGLSSGLYYVPGSYANTEEVVALAKVAAKHGGIYDTHIRDESTFTVGFIPALQEAISIAEKAGIHLHLAHIKALGVDVWGKSKEAVKLIEQAQKAGVSLSADQYPWLASGTKLHSAVIPKWVMADSVSAFHQRLNDPQLSAKIDQQITENIRRRGGATALLITAFSDPNLVGLTLKDVANKWQVSAVDAAKKLVQLGEVRVASFNMSPDDVEHFMQQPWVVTSSDGTNGHPRKYASFPTKYQEYVVKKGLLSLDQFITRSSGKTAQLLKLDKIGKIKEGYQADIIVFDAKNYRPNADFSNWNLFSSGISTVIINGKMVIRNGKYQQILAGKFIPKS